MEFQTGIVKCVNLKGNTNQQQHQHILVARCCRWKSGESRIMCRVVSVIYRYIVESKGQWRRHCSEIQSAISHLMNYVHIK